MGPRIAHAADCEGSASRCSGPSAPVPCQGLQPQRVLALVQSRADVLVEPICPEAEAQLAHLSVAQAFDITSLPVAVVDIGGGSTEIILGAGGLVEQVWSLPLGEVRLTEQFGGPDTSAGDLYDKMRREVRRVLERTVKKMAFVPQLIVGTGGTFTSLANSGCIATMPRRRTALALDRARL